MAVGKNDSIGGSKVGEVIAAFDKLVGCLADGRTIFRDGLIKAHRNSAAAIPVKNYLRHMLGVSQIIDALSHIQRYQLPVHDGFVVFKARIHTEDHKSSFGELR